MSAQANDAYALERTQEEERRLQRQSALLDPFTNRLFAAAGIGPGMKVLDIGSGAGDVAILVAKMVGPTGQVFGVDIDAPTVETARRRANAAGYTNIVYTAGDLREIPLADDFDAIVGRLILCHLPDRVAVLRRLMPHLRRGGVAAFYDLDLTVPGAAYPPTELTRSIFRWFEQGITFAGIEPAMGMQLHRVLQEAGFEDPQITVDALAGGTRAFLEEYTTYATDTVRALLPLLIKGGFVTPEEVGIGTLAQRWRDELLSLGGMVRSSLFMGGWARKG